MAVISVGIALALVFGAGTTTHKGQTMTDDGMAHTMAKLYRAAGLTAPTEAELAQAYAQGYQDGRRGLEEALRDLFALMDEGYLVRDTSHDGSDGWAIRQIPFVRRLATARAALDATEKETLSLASLDRALKDNPAETYLAPDLNPTIELGERNKQEKMIAHLTVALRECVSQITALCSANDVPDSARAALAKLAQPQPATKGE